MKRVHIILVSILCIGTVFRAWQLSSVPPSPSLDEVSIGWNAYSLATTGNDEYGAQFPLLLRAYDDWRPALYVYFVIPFVSLFGLSAIAVRIPSVIVSVLSILCTYFLGKKLFQSSYIGLLAGLFLAVSPWHVYISRLGHEANAGLAFMIGGITLFFYKRYAWAVVSLALSFMSYQPQKLLVPILLLSLLYIQRDYFLAYRKRTLLLFALGMVLILPFVIVSLNPDASIRFRATSIFNPHSDVFTDARDAFAHATARGDQIARVQNHKYVVGARIVFQQYISHFDLQWLITNTGSEPHKVPGLGIVYWWELFGLIIGWVLLIKSRAHRAAKLILSTIILSAPLTAAVTTGAPHAMRSYTAIPAVQLIAAYGWYFIYKRLPAKRVFLMSAGIVLCLSTSTLYNGYFHRFPREQSDSFQYPLTQSISYVATQADMYEHVVFSNQRALYQSYMFYLFHTAYDPVDYQRFGGTVSGGYAEEHAFDTVSFRPIASDDTRDTVLYIANSDEVPSAANILQRFYTIDGQDHITVYTF